MPEPLTDDQLAVLRRWADADVLPTRPAYLRPTVARLLAAETERAALTARVAALAAALDTYGEHLPGCPLGDDCQCGLLAALADPS